MALSPCPKCNDKQAFDVLAQHKQVFVVQRGSRDTVNPKYHCENGHGWEDGEIVRQELRVAGFDY